jgi:hypothetical protein
MKNYLIDFERLQKKTRFLFQEKKKTIVYIIFQLKRLAILNDQRENCISYARH